MEDLMTYYECPRCKQKTLYLADFDLVACINCNFESHTYLPLEVAFIKEEAEKEIERKWFRKQEDGDY